MAQASSPGEQSLTFQVSGRNFSLPARLVREVAQMPRLARVPHAPDGLMGLANVRGVVVPIVSMDQLLDGHGGVPKRVIVVDAGEPIGLAVESVSQVAADHERTAGQRIDVESLIAGIMTAKVSRRSSGGLVGALAGEAVHAEELALVTFAIGSQEFALPIASVQEVLRLPGEIALMPHADAVVIGTILVRGEILPLLSLHALLALGGETNARSRILVVLIGAHRIGLVVDAMREVRHVPEADIDAVPHVLNRGGAEARIQAICRLDDNRRLVSILAVEQLVREDITARLLQGRSELEREETANMSEAVTEQFLLFRIGDEEFGLPIAAVEEVVALPPRLTALPRSPSFVQGVINLRGAVIPVIDQRLRFNGAATDGRKRRVVVVRIGDLQAGFLVDSVSEILRVPTEALREAPELGSDGTRVFERVANLPEQDKIVLIISPRELLDRAERDLLASLCSPDATTST